MNETPEERKARLAQQAVDGAKAAVEYRQKMDATLRRTAELRAQRLARESAQQNGHGDANAHGEAPEEKPVKAKRRAR